MAKDGFDFMLFGQDETLEDPSSGGGGGGRHGKSSSGKKGGDTRRESYSNVDSRNDSHRKRVSSNSSSSTSSRVSVVRKNMVGSMLSGAAVSASTAAVQDKGNGLGSMIREAIQESKGDDDGDPDFEDEGRGSTGFVCERNISEEHDDYDHHEVFVDLAVEATDGGSQQQRDDEKERQQKERQERMQLEQYGHGDHERETLVRYRGNDVNRPVRFE